jgi:hypothetical protein
MLYQLSYVRLNDELYCHARKWQVWHLNGHEELRGEPAQRPVGTGRPEPHPLDRLSARAAVIELPAFGRRLRE